MRALYLLLPVLVAALYYYDWVPQRQLAEHEASDASANRAKVTEILDLENRLDELRHKRDAARQQSGAKTMAAQQRKLQEFFPKAKTKILPPDSNEALFQPAIVELTFPSVNQESARKKIEALLQSNEPVQVDTLDIGAETTQLKLRMSPRHD